MRFLFIFLLALVSACANPSYEAKPNVSLDNDYKLGRLMQCRTIAESCDLYSDSAYILSTDLREISDPETNARQGVEVELVTSDEKIPDPEHRYGGRSRITCQFQGERLTSVLKDGEKVPFQQCETFRVFFDWNKSDLKSEAFKVVEAAVQRAKAASYQRIIVIGHADRSGTDNFNLRLSDRRAQTVKLALVRLGIASNRIVVVPKGETMPLVPTDDGVREPQNRRVRIWIER